MGNFYRPRPEGGLTDRRKGAQMVYLLSPTAKNRLTGGYIYNDCIATRLAQRCHFTYSLISSIEELPNPSGVDLIILDSLFMIKPDIQAYLAYLAGKHKVYGLIHFLPGCDPFLTTLQRRHLVRLEDRFLSAIDGCITVSGAIGKELVNRGFSEKNIHICPPGVDKDFFSPSPYANGAAAPPTNSTAPPPTDGIPPPPYANFAGSPPADGTPASPKERAAPHSTARPTERKIVLLTVSYISRSKNLLWLLKLTETLKDQQWVWRIAGDYDRTGRDPYVARFFEELERSPVRENSILLGVQDRTQIRDELRAADVFVFPSVLESYGMVFLEAAACGLPVIANRVGAVDSIIEDEKTGYICEPCDAEKWRRSLTSLIGSRERRLRFSAALRERRASLSSWDDAAERFFRCLDKMLGR